MHRSPSGTTQAPSTRKPNFLRRGRTPRVQPSTHSAILPSLIVYIRSWEIAFKRSLPMDQIRLSRGERCTAVCAERCRGWTWEAAPRTRSGLRRRKHGRIGRRRRRRWRSHGGRHRSRWRHRIAPCRRPRDRRVEVSEARRHTVLRLPDNPEEHHIPDECETGREEDAANQEREQPRRLPGVRRSGRIRQELKDSSRHGADHPDSDDAEHGNQYAGKVRPPSRLGGLQGPKHEPIHLAFRGHPRGPEDRDEEGHVQNRWGRAPEQEARAPGEDEVHDQDRGERRQGRADPLEQHPRLAFAACCGPYSSAPWCIRITAIRLTMKLMTKTMTRPHTADPVIAAAPIALAEFDVTIRIDERPTISAKTPKMMSRMRVT